MHSFIVLLKNESLALIGLALIGSGFGESEGEGRELKDLGLFPTVCLFYIIQIIILIYEPNSWKVILH